MVALGVLRGTPSQTVELGLRNHAGLGGAKNVGHTAAGNLLGKRRRVELVDEERKMEHVALRIVQGNEEILSIDDFFESVVNLMEKFVEVGGLIERVNNVGKNQALRLHALDLGDILVADKHGPDAGIGHTVDRFGVEPAVLAGLGAQVRAPTGGPFRAGGEGGESLPEQTGIGRSVQQRKRLAHQLFREISKSAGKAFIDEKEVPGRGHHGEQVTGSGKQSPGLAFRACDIVLRQQTF